MAKRRLITFLALIIAIGLGYSVYGLSKEERGDTAIAKRDTVIRAVYATGTVEPVYWAKLASYKTARLMEILHPEGDAIKKGDVIARMENRAETQRLEEAKAKLDFAKKELARNIILTREKAISRKELEDAQREEREIYAQVQALQQAVSDLTLISPVDGIVLRRDMELGEIAQAGQTIFWVGQPIPLRITADVDEEDIAQVKLNQKAVIKADAFAGQVFEGTVSEITPKGDPVNKVFRARITLPENTPLLTGMTTEVNIITQTIPNALVIPSTAENGGFAWRMDGRKKTKTPVKTGVRDESHVQITEGLKEGDMVLSHAPSTTEK
jgi:RND family efflux transporter MFP subunit